MKNKKPIIIILSAIVLFISAIAVYHLISESETTLELSVQDSVSEGWVWDLEMILDKNIIHGYFQSDKGTKPFLFRGLTPGEYTLNLSAPNYLPRQIPIRIKRGKNVFDGTIKMEGLEIPELNRFFVFEELTDNVFLMNLRPVSNKGRALINHPCINLWFGCRVSEQMTGTELSLDELNEGADRGRELFKGQLNWEWNSSPEVQFRYSSKLPKSELIETDAKLLVFDYLVLVPEKGKIETKELEKIIEKAWLIQDESEFITFLSGYREQFYFYIDTSWNVRRDG